MCFKCQKDSVAKCLLASWSMHWALDSRALTTSQSLHALRPHWGLARLQRCPSSAQQPGLLCRVGFCDCLAFVDAHSSLSPPDFQKDSSDLCS